ncbi:Hypothetical protein D9617_57g029010 [Elsinoe fawcettii]|nr:Hypothetical protein D9617_57g029010 [Elsinoe fawcettii]
MDEKGFLLGRIAKAKPIFPKDLQASGKLLGAGQDRPREWVTIVAMVCADGTTLPPLLIYEGNSGSIQDFNSNHHDAYFTSSPNRWTSDDIGFKWLEALFDKKTQYKARRAWRLLFKSREDHQRLSSDLDKSRAETVLERIDKEKAIEALGHEKKRKRGKKLIEEFRAEEGSGAILFSPGKIRSILELQDRWQQHKKQEREQKEHRAQERTATKLLKEQEAQRKREERAAAQAIKREQLALQKASKAAEKEAKKAQKRLEQQTRATNKKPPAKRRRPATSAPSTSRRRGSRRAGGVVDPPPAPATQAPPESPLALPQTPPSPLPEDQPPPEGSPPSAQPPPVFNSSPPPPEVLLVSRSRRNTESLEREFEQSLDWTLSWTLKLASQILYSDTERILERSAAEHWLEALEPLVRENFNRKGVTRFELNSFKVVAKLSRRGVQKVSYTRGDLDWRQLDQAVKSWSLRYPTEQITADLWLHYLSRDATQLPLRTLTTVGMLEDLSQQTTQGGSPYSSNYAHLINQWKYLGNCSLNL